jgi:hypothetical protein
MCAPCCSAVRKPRALVVAGIGSLPFENYVIRGMLEARVNTRNLMPVHAVSWPDEDWWVGKCVH